jgi:CMP/dCMP kinase
MANDDTTITIDGPAGSGKTTVAAELAKRLGYRFLDTGAMYRAATLSVLRAGIADPADPQRELPEDEVVAAVERAHIDLIEDGAVTMSGIIVGNEIRTQDVTDCVSAVSALRGVRLLMTAKQREFGVRARPGLVAEGRDMASVVFPRSKHRFYLEAKVEVRAARRLKQLREKHDAARRAGKPAEPVPALAEIIAALAKRDQLDSEREEAPLRRVPGVVEIDTDDLDVAGVVAALERTVASQRHA